jgi:hypothetical protein
MKNSVVASIEFYFKGEKYTPSMTVDLDFMMTAHGAISDLHASIATHNGIDTYSYLYEVMESETIHYDQPSGLAADYTQDGVFDVEGFARAWQEQKVLAAVAPIAGRCMAVDDLERQPQLKQALIEAYQAGLAARSSD